MKKSAILLLFSAILFSGCHSNSKDERYNNMTPNEIYKQGTKNVTKQRFAEAVEDFEALESRYPFGDYADKAQLGAIYALYQNEDYPAALAADERFIRMYPRHPNVDYAHYLKGLIHFSESMGFFGNYIPFDREDRDPTPARKALQAFNTLTLNYPNSIYVEDAKMRMVYLRNLLAAHEVVAARYYMKKGAYLAAANRASYIISQFDRSPSLPEALAIQVQAYRNLQLNSLAEDSYRVLVLNYPNSYFVEELG